MHLYPSLSLSPSSQGLGIIATATGYLLGAFKLRYPHVHNMADAGEVLFGPVGREVLGTAQVVFLVFSCGGHVLTGMIAFDTSTLPLFFILHFSFFILFSDF